MATEKTAGELLSEKLFYKKQSGFDVMSDEEMAVSEQFCDDYKLCLCESKTEREWASMTAALAERAGFKAYVPGELYGPGSRFYAVSHGKAVYLIVKGREPMSAGVNITAAHIDSPRLDLKPLPLFEDDGLAYFKTHYYGGVKRYQWTALPLSLHGVVMRKDGTSVEVCIGECEKDPVFCITDLLPHLAKEQMGLTLKDAIKGENMHVLIGSRPFKDDKASHKVKLNIMSILHEKYGFTEEDFLCAELELVPALPVKDVGFDRSLIGGYGHDDRVCAYTALRAILETKEPERTCICCLVDKEEVGSDGNTGLKSHFLRHILAELADGEGSQMRDSLKNSRCFSADVAAAFDPTYPEPYDTRNSARLNYGVAVVKYVGAGGKGGTSDANAEFMGFIRNMLAEAGVLWQAGSMGKVDAGGGGTVAKYIANLDVETVDIGVPVLSMHSPWEIVSKIDVYMAYKAFLAFNQAK